MTVYSDPYCENPLRQENYSLYACSEQEVGISNFYHNNEEYLLSQQKDAPSAYSAPIYYMYTKCTSYLGLSFNVFVEDGIIHYLLYDNKHSCSGHATDTNSFCDALHSPLFISDPRMVWYSMCGKNENTPNVDMCTLSEEGAVVIMQTRRKYFVAYLYDISCELLG